MALNKVGIVALGVVAGVAVFVMTRKPTSQGAASSKIEQAFSDASNYVGETVGAFLRVGNMSSVDKRLVDNANVRAFLRVIRTGEGTADADGYRRIFGGRLFTSYADHPRVLVKSGGLSSTAAGAYQFLSSTWDETRAKMGLADFSPRSQDVGALGRIAARGALPDVLAGRFDTAIKKVAHEWASLPGSPYGQPTISLAKARQVYLASGGDASGNLA